MSTIYRTVDGDVIDAICKEHYGSEAHATKVYEANPGLARLGPTLPKGLEIVLPEIKVDPVRQLKRLW